MNPNTPCIQPIASCENKITNNTSRIVADVLQPLRQRRSAKSSETTPVKIKTDEKKMNSRSARRIGRCESAVTLNWAVFGALDVATVGIIVIQDQRNILAKNSRIASR